MKKEPNMAADMFRIQPPGFESSAGWNCGAFRVSLKGATLRVMASDGNHEIPWEHVSVSLEDRCPTWSEMCFVKDLFWSGDETVIQYHPPKSEYVNCHEFCLHLWKKIGCRIETPPTIAIGPR